MFSFFKNTTVEDCTWVCFTNVSLVPRAMAHATLATGNFKTPISNLHSFPVFHTKTERWTRTEHIASVAMLIPGVYLSVRLKQARRERTKGQQKREKPARPRRKT